MSLKNVPPPASPEWSGLSWDAPVARELVHRSNDGEVLVTSTRRIRSGRFHCAAGWRRNHRTFSANNGGHNPLLIAETIRQACICLSLEYLGIDPGTRFVIKSLAFDLDPRSAPTADGDRTDVCVDVAVGGLRRDDRTGRTVALTMRARFSAAGRRFATAAGAARLFDEREYAALRAGADAADRPPAAVGGLVRPAPWRVAVDRADDVVIARAPDGSWLVDPADPVHPFFFDHAVDHLPGMLLLEAARQHALVRAGDPGLRLTGMRMRPLRFAERLPQPSFCGGDTGTAAPGTGAFGLAQAGRSVLEGSLAFCRPPDAR